MEGFKALKEKVQKNCDLVDAEYGQNYGLCIYLLKMRDYYRWQNRIPLHQEIVNKEILNWIADTEERWEGIAGNSLEDIPFDGKIFDPFASNAINEVLFPQGLVYSGGLGYGAIPLFFLAELIEKSDQHGFTILISGREFARIL